MSGLGDLADKLGKAAAALRDHGALDAAKNAGDAYLLALGARTPVRSGKLKASERVDRIAGDGLRAVVTIGAHTVYADFREHGGKITVKRFPQLGNPEAGWFGKSVTQEGSWYFRGANEWAEGGGLDVPVRKAIIAILEDAGL